MPRPRSCGPARRPPRRAVRSGPWKTGAGSPPTPLPAWRPPPGATGWSSRNRARPVRVSTASGRWPGRSRRSYPCWTPAICGSPARTWRRRTPSSTPCWSASSPRPAPARRRARRLPRAVPARPAHGVRRRGAEGPARRARPRHPADPARRPRRRPLLARGAGLGDQAAARALAGRHRAEPGTRLPRRRGRPPGERDARRRGLRHPRDLPGRATVGRPGHRDRRDRRGRPGPYVGGPPGSGKTIFLYALIGSLAARYSPDELELYLLDFKEGVSFARLASGRTDKTWLPHARLIGVNINNDREFGVALLRFLGRELERRGAAAREHEVTKLEELRAADPDGHWPRIVAVIDEFQVLIQQKD